MNKNSRKYRILLINPYQDMRSWIMYKERNLLSLSFTTRTIKAITPDDFEVKLIDQCVEDIDFDADVDLVGVTSLTHNSYRAYKVAEEFKKRNKPVVMGGYHATFLPEEAKKCVDSVVIGEAENVWPELLNDFKNGKLKAFYKSNLPAELQGLPIAAKEKYYGSKYGSFSMPYPMHASRGCTNGCSYCSINRFYNRTIRYRPIIEIIDEIKKTGYKFIAFMDDNLILDAKYAKEFFAALKPLNIKWTMQTSILIAEHEELLKLAAESGCFCFYIGVESINQLSLDSVDKKINRAEKFLAAFKKIKEYEISIVLLIIFGFDGDTKSVFNQTLDFLKEAGVLNAEFSMLVPFPGTLLYKKLKKENRILSYDWKNYNPGWHCVFQPKNMEPHELEAGFKKVLIKYNTPFWVLKRLIAGGKKIFLTMPGYYL
ncbi:radical SAM protein [Candidatus Parcubacteria bacterium]|nr:MAG: radical SAM protein [Candidatus Parcubacteria bacterium]